MDVFQKHQFAIAKQTLRYSDVGARIMGGMTKDQAREFLANIANWSTKRIALYEQS